MNDITKALQAAGVPLPPQIKRLWLVIKDNPGITTQRAAQILNLSPSNTSALAPELVRRGMVTVGTTKVRVNGPRGSVMTRNVQTYTVSPRMQGEYELLPMPKKAKVPKETVQVPARMLPPEPKPTPAPKEPAPPAAFGVDLDALTVAQARALYAVLHKMFGGK